MSTNLTDQDSYAQDQLEILKECYDLVQVTVDRLVCNFRYFHENRLALRITNRWLNYLIPKANAHGIPLTKRNFIGLVLVTAYFRLRLFYAPRAIVYNHDDQNLPENRQRIDEFTRRIQNFHLD